MITTDKRGTRTYLRGETYHVRALIKDSGGRWDASERAWWFDDGLRAQQIAASIGQNAAARAPVPGLPRTKTRTKTPPAPREGEQEISRPSTGRHDRYTVGQVIRAPRIQGGGGPDGHYFTVVADNGKWKTDDDEWMVGAIVRPATDAEAAPIVKARTDKEQRAALLQELEKLVRNLDNLCPDGTWPAGGEKLDVSLTLAGSRTYVLGDDGAVWHTVSSYDDVPRAWRTDAPRAREVLTELLAQKKGAKS